MLDSFGLLYRCSEHKVPFIVQILETLGKSKAPPFISLACKCLNWNNVQVSSVKQFIWNRYNFKRRTKFHSHTEAGHYSHAWGSFWFFFFLLCVPPPCPACSCFIHLSPLVRTHSPESLWTYLVSSKNRVHCSPQWYWTLKQNSTPVVMPQSRIISHLSGTFLLRRLNKWAGRVGPATSVGGTGYNANLDLPTCDTDPGITAQSVYL